MGNTMCNPAAYQDGQPCVEKTTGSWPKPLYKDSKLILPKGVRGEIPVLIAVHGTTGESWLKGKLLSMVLTGGDLEKTMEMDCGWTQMDYVSNAIVEECGAAVMVIALPDDDEAPEGGIANTWWCSYYSKALAAAIEHVCEAVPAESSGTLSVDKSKIGLLGHSAGGGGVLFAAGADCRDLISCVVALDPGMFCCFKVYDYAEKAFEYANEEYFSGKGGDLQLDVLKNIKPSTKVFVHSSQAQYNTPIVLSPPPRGMSSIVPNGPSIMSQIPCEKKELFIDNVGVPADMKATPEEANKIFMTSHMWPFSANSVKSYGDGVPLAAITSFVRRHLVGLAEEPMPRPSIAVEWQVAS